MTDYGSLKADIADAKRCIYELGLPPAVSSVKGVLEAVTILSRSYVALVTALEEFRSTLESSATAETLEKLDKILEMTKR